MEPDPKRHILRFPLVNKGTGFSQEERDRYGLNGLLPYHVSTEGEQLKRCRANFAKKQTPLGKYVYLMSLMNRNEALFYKFISKHPEEMLPYIYTPTVGEASIHFSSLSWSPRGIYISYPLKGKMEEMVANIPNEEVDVMVLTDGERILGLGDQGIGGMTIPIGKLALYTLFGGIHPAKTLPVLIDVGTNNQELLDNELYLGWRQKRISGAEYDAFIGAFVKAVKKRYPKALLQWEDFGNRNARRLLEMYRHKILSFNDDIQGTAAVVVAALLSALKIAEGELKDQKVAILGGGSAGLGIADMIVEALVANGLTKEEAYRRIYIVDVAGLLQFNLPREQIQEAQEPYVKTAEDLRGWNAIHPQHISLLDVMKNAKPQILIGVCAQPGTFSQEVIEAMHQGAKRPIIFPLSNPTSRAECIPSDAIQWTKGDAIVATGTLFQPVEYGGKKYEIAQCNNVYIFPGLGLGALASEAKEITDGMLFEAAKALAAHAPALKDKTASLLPRIGDVREVSRAIAIAVAKEAIREGVSSISQGEIEARIDKVRWNP